MTGKSSASRARTGESTQYPASELVQIPQAWDKLGDTVGQRSRKKVPRTETSTGTAEGSAGAPVSGMERHLGPAQRGLQGGRRLELSCGPGAGSSPEGGGVLKSLTGSRGVEKAAETSTVLC